MGQVLFDAPWLALLEWGGLIAGLISVADEAGSSKSGHGDFCGYIARPAN